LANRVASLPCDFLGCEKDIFFKIDRGAHCFLQKTIWELASDV
jgi:hypothetical protein